MNWRRALKPKIRTLVLLAFAIALCVALSFVAPTLRGVRSIYAPFPLLKTECSTIAPSICASSIIWWGMLASAGFWLVLYMVANTFLVERLSRK